MFLMGRKGTTGGYAVALRRIRVLPESNHSFTDPGLRLSGRNSLSRVGRGTAGWRQAPLGVRDLAPPRYGGAFSFSQPCHDALGLPVRLRLVGNEAPGRAYPARQPPPPPPPPGG